MNKDEDFDDTVAEEEGLESRDYYKSDEEYTLAKLDAYCRYTGDYISYDAWEERELESDETIKEINGTKVIVCCQYGYEG